MMNARLLVWAGLALVGGCAAGNRPQQLHAVDRTAAQAWRDQAEPERLAAKSSFPRDEFASARLASSEDASERCSEFRDPGAFDRAVAAPIVIDFDDLSPGTDLSGTLVHGVTFVAHSARLIVANAADTYISDGYEAIADPGAYRLLATSGGHILSPGGAQLAPGPNPALEDDDITLIFDPPVSAVGFDFLTPSADGLSFTNVTIISESGATLHMGGIGIAHRSTRASAQPSPFPPPSADFFGFVSPQANIREVRIDEQDDNAVCPDANIGIDSLRFSPAPPGAAHDLTGDRIVSAADLLSFIAGATSAQVEAPAAGPLIDAAQLVRLLSAWGE